VAYICCRCYRAPELILGSRYYTSAVDLWSVGCTVAEMASGNILFIGKDNARQLTSIAKVLGPPSPTDLAGMHVAVKPEKLPSPGPRSSLA
jgi:serine/threonine protein kinase